MIWESYPWREELCRIADRLGGWGRAIRPDDEMVAFAVERDLMVSAYAIRKLSEARKLATSTSGHRIAAESFRLVGNVPDHMNWHRVDEFYDFEHPAIENLDLVALCNQLIHSFVFILETSDASDIEDVCRLEGLFVASDRSRSSTIYRIPLSETILAIRKVGAEDVVATEMTRDADGQWKVLNRAANDADAPHAPRDLGDR